MNGVRQAATTSAESKPKNPFSQADRTTWRGTRVDSASVHRGQCKGHDAAEAVAHDHRPLQTELLAHPRHVAREAFDRVVLLGASLSPCPRRSTATVRCRVAKWASCGARKRRSQTMPLHEHHRWVPGPELLVAQAYPVPVQPRHGRISLPPRRFSSRVARSRCRLDRGKRGQIRVQHTHRLRSRRRPEPGGQKMRPRSLPSSRTGCPACPPRSGAGHRRVRSSKPPPSSAPI